jgi:PPOX class probable F420-dependent enzyme
MNNVPKTLAYLLEDETKAFAFLATIMPDRSPQVTPVWFSTDGQHILVNSAKGRVKDSNIRSRPRVSLAIPDPENPYRYLQIRGRVVEVTTEGAEEHIQKLAMTYTGKPFEIPQGQVRIIFKILPEKFDPHP